jgi:predicted nucleotidyltransferase
MPDSIPAMRAVADCLDPAGWHYAFVVGAIVNLLLDHPEFTPARSTDDVDLIHGIAANVRYSTVEEQMRVMKFDHDMSKGAPKCRWLLGDLKVDVMPTDGSGLGLNTHLFAEALSTVREQTVRADIKLKLVSPPAFIALKLVAFADRGKGDYYGSQDLEDLLTVIDGREAIVHEIDATVPALRNYTRDEFRRLNEVRDFWDLLPGILESDDASQARLPLLERKLREIAGLRD